MNTWAKRLREHPYCGAKIPMMTLHRLLHQKIHDVPCPSEEVCETVWRELESLRLSNAIDPKKDSPIRKLSIIIYLLTQCNDQLDATIAVLKWQRQVIRKFYEASH